MRGNTKLNPLIITFTACSNIQHVLELIINYDFRSSNMRAQVIKSTR